MNKTIADRAAPVAELTLRGIILGGIITLGFTAANVYLGLKIGLTFATSIPAAVISMAVLRMMKGATILENNIVQTVASAAGTLAAIIFVLPGLVMIGWWQGFPYFTTAAIIATGGMLGVLFSVPLRRALVTGSDLPYPEGRAAAEVLIIGDSRDGGEENRRGLWMLVWSSLASAGFAALAQTRLVVSEATVWFRAGAGATGVSGGLSFALLGAGHLVGLSVGIAQFIGMIIGFGILLPILTAAHPMPGDVEAWASGVFRNDVRFFGAGVIAVAAIWSLARIIGPVVRGIRSSLAASAAAQGGGALAIEERDIPIQWIALLSVAMLAPIGWLLWSAIAGGPLQGAGVALIVGGLLFVIVIGLIIAAVCGYMAGLIGASNSPVSGVGILAIVASSLLLVGLFGRGTPPGTTAALVAYALVATGIVFGVATISNDNLQDLKTGQLVGATPWKQQVALMIGVVFGALIIPPVLNVLNQQFGFAGMPGAGPNALPAPQAALISALAQGVLGGHLNWPMIFGGMATGVVVALADEGLRLAKLMRLPPLAVGIGIYLPMSITSTLVIGAVAGHFYDNWAKRRPKPEMAERMGVLAATGMIVGESLFGVVFAGLAGVTGSDSPLALVGGGFAPVALVGGTIGFFALAALLYLRTCATVRQID